MRLSALVLALAGLLIAVPAAAVDRVVDTAGVACISGAPVYTTIDAALVAAVPGETIVVCAGDYLLDDSVNINTASVTLRAQGTVRIKGSQGLHFGFVVFADDVTVQGFEFSSYSFCAIDVERDRADIRDNRVTGGLLADAGICVNNFTTGHRIRYNVVEAGGGGGILFRGDAGEISNNTVSGIFSFGIALVNCDAVVVHHNLVIGAPLAGIEVDACEAAITDNTVRGPSVAGIQFTGASFAVISHNAVRDTSTGVLLDDAHVVTVSFNSIVFNDVGLDVKTSDDVTVTRNNVSRSTTVDCRWDGFGTNVLTDNNCGKQDPPGAFD